MRLGSRTPWFVAAAVAVLAAGIAGSASLRADDDDEDGLDPARKAELEKIAHAAYEKAVARGKEIWNDAANVKKSCSKCHDDPAKPDLNLATREYSYPAYSRRKRAIVTLDQKIQEMVTDKSRGQRFDEKSGDIAAVQAYIASLRAKK